MTWAISVPILVVLGLSVLDLGPIYATDVRQTDVRRASSLNAPALWVRGLINILPVKTRLYEALVLSTLLNSAELWPISVTQMKKNSKQHTTDGNEVSLGFPGRTK